MAWCDLTVPNATETRDFYAAVVGWKPTGLEMEGYEDYCMNRPEDGQTAAGICHRQGPNADLPPVWLVYFTVSDLQASLESVLSKGGKIVRPAKEMGGGKMAVIQDPSGAICALFQT
jgi:hypothetical protein